MLSSVTSNEATTAPLIMSNLMPRDLSVDLQPAKPFAPIATVNLSFAVIVDKDQDTSRFTWLRPTAATSSTNSRDPLSTADTHAHAMLPLPTLTNDIERIQLPVSSSFQYFSSLIIICYELISVLFFWTNKNLYSRNGQADKFQHILICSSCSRLLS